MLPLKTDLHLVLFVNPDILAERTDLQNVLLAVQDLTLISLELYPAQSALLVLSLQSRPL